MAWSDAPSEGQMGAWWRLTKWALPDNVQTAALEWLEKKLDRKAMSDELSRVRSLYIGHKLDKNSCFDSLVWDGFEYKDKYKREGEELRREVMRKMMA